MERHFVDELIALPLGMRQGEDARKYRTAVLEVLGKRDQYELGVVRMVIEGVGNARSKSAAAGTSVRAAQSMLCEETMTRTPSAKKQSTDRSK